MNTRRFVFHVLATVLLVPGFQCPPLGPGEREADLSGFREFEYAQRGGLMPCDDMTFYSAWIRRQDDGSDTVEFTAGERYQPPDCTWDEDGWGITCASAEGEMVVVSPAVPARPLTDAESRRVRDLFRAVRLETRYYDPICIDVCGFTRIRWDDFTPETVVGCLQGYYEVLERSMYDDIEHLLDDLRGAGPPA